MLAKGPVDCPYYEEVDVPGCEGARGRCRHPGQRSEAQALRDAAWCVGQRAHCRLSKEERGDSR